MREGDQPESRRVKVFLMPYMTTHFTGIDIFQRSRSKTGQSSV
jgi:hypothetical protein